MSHENDVNKNNDGKTIQVVQKHYKCIGLQNFISLIEKELDLHCVDNVLFNMNSRGIIHSWKLVFEIEKMYTSCLGIKERVYEFQGYTHDPIRNVAYFVLEEENIRTYSFLPSFHFNVLVFNYYDPKTRNIVKVDVQYDQLSFYLNCMGLMQIHTWLVSRVLTPLAISWLKLFRITGIAVNPFTFLLNLVGIMLAVFWLRSRD